MTRKVGVLRWVAAVSAFVALPVVLFGLAVLLAEAFVPVTPPGDGEDWITPAELLILVMIVDLPFVSLLSLGIFLGEHAVLQRLGVRRFLPYAGAGAVCSIAYALPNGSPDLLAQFPAFALAGGAVCGGVSACAFWWILVRRQKAIIPAPS